MKFQQVMILLALATLAMVAVGAMGHCREHFENSEECDKCCVQNNFGLGKLDFAGDCRCQLPGYKPIVDRRDPNYKNPTLSGEAPCHQRFETDIECNSCCLRNKYGYGEPEDLRGYCSCHLYGYQRAEPKIDYHTHYL